MGRGAGGGSGGEVRDGRGEGGRPMRWALEEGIGRAVVNRLCKCILHW